MKTVASRSSSISGSVTTRCLALVGSMFVAVSLYCSFFPAIQQAIRRPPSTVDFASSGSGGSLRIAASSDPVCDGKRIYMHKLPPDFNQVLMENCAMVKRYELDMCRNVVDGGFGPPVEFASSKDPLREVLVPNEAWFQTYQFSLEMIFHARMKHYRCLTEDPEAANVFYVPYYGGVDLERYLFSPKVQMRDRLVQRLVGWLQANPYWNRRQGRDHFLVLGRIAWDFCREVEDEQGWGSCLLTIPALKNATRLVIEKESKAQVAVPYPTPFHPRSMDDVRQWQAVVRQSERPHRVSFTGMPRVGNRDSAHPTWKKHVRELVLSECEQSPICTMFECRRSVNCTTLKQHELIGVALKSVFCLQPPGDSPTRKATFDSLLAGCIPVFVSPYTAYTQYLWHLPAEGNSYSVFVKEEDIFDQHENKTGHGVHLLGALASIPEERIRNMRETIVSLIPQIVYADGRGREEGGKIQAETVSGDSLDFKDAFAIMVERLTQTLRF